MLVIRRQETIFPRRACLIGNAASTACFWSDPLSEIFAVPANPELAANHNNLVLVILVRSVEAIIVCSEKKP